MATFTKINSFVEALAEKVHNLGADQLMVALTAAANPPLASNTQLSNLTEDQIISNKAWFMFNSNLNQGLDWEGAKQEAELEAEKLDHGRDYDEFYIVPLDPKEDIGEGAGEPVIKRYMKVTNKEAEKP